MRLNEDPNQDNSNNKRNINLRFKMSNLIGVYVATMFVAAAFVGCSPFGSKDTSLVNEICNTSKHPSKRLATVVKLNELVGEINRSYAQCPDRVKSSILDLNDLIHKHESDVCSQKSANDIAAYYWHYMASKDNNTNNLIEFSKALKKFFISYGLKVSSFCRKQMADRLVGEAQKLIEPADFLEVADYTGQKRYIAAFMGDPSENKDHKHLAFPKNFVKMMHSFQLFNVTNQQRLLLQVSTTKKIHRIQAVCERRFTPIYKDLILPLVTLAEVGFNYNGAEDSRLEPSVIKQVYEWYRIVFLCEAMNKVEFFQSPEDQEKGAKSDRRLVRILDREEADILRGDESAMIDTAGVDYQRIDYKPELESMPLDGVVYDSNDSRLEKAIMSFRRRTRNHNDPDMARKMVKFVKDKVSRGGIKLMGKLSGIKNLPANGRLTGMDMVNLLDEYEHAVETGDSKSVSAIPSFFLGNNYLIFTLVIIAIAFLLMCFIPLG